MKPREFSMKAISALFIILLTSCSLANGQISSGVINGPEKDATVKKTIPVGAFNSVMAAQGIRVVFVQGTATGEAEIATTPSAEKYLEIAVTGNTLNCRYKNLDKRIKGPSIVKVTAPDLKEVEVSSGASFNAEGTLKLKSSLDIETSSGGGVVFGSLSCTSLEAEASSGGSIKLGSVKTGNADLKSSSGGSVKADVMNSASLKNSASSGGGINVKGIDADDVKASASSGAEIKLEGVCKSFIPHKSSGASLKVSSLKTK